MIKKIFKMYANQIDNLKSLNFPVFKLFKERLIQIIMLMKLKTQEGGYYKKKKKIFLFKNNKFKK